MTIRSRRNFILPLAAALALLVDHASAGTTFNGGAAATTGNWDAAANWEGVLPTFNDTTDLLFKATNANNRTTSLIASAKTVRSLTFNSNVTNNFEIRLTSAPGLALNLTMGSATNAAAITVNSGAVTNITIGKGTAATTGNLILANNLTVDQNSTAGTLTIDAPITETGGSYGLTKNGAGSLVLSSTNTYTGATTISGGELVLSGSGRLSSSSTLDLSGSTARLNISGITAAGSTNASLAGVAGSVVNLGSKNLQVGGNNTSTTFAGVLTNTGSLTKSGTGTLTLSGANTYSGATAVSAGSLIVNGDQSAASGILTVSSGATLGGSGAIGGATTISGILAPGNSIGTLTVANDVTWNGGENWVFELGAAGPTIGSSGTSDLLSITGAGSDFLKGTGASWSFDFAGTGDLGWYKLVEWAGTSDFAANDFLGTNLGGGYTSEFSIQDSALYVNVVPEPSTYALLALSAAGFGWHVIRRRRR